MGKQYITCISIIQQVFLLQIIKSLSPMAKSRCIFLEILYAEMIRIIRQPIGYAAYGRYSACSSTVLSIDPNCYRRGFPTWQRAYRSRAIKRFAPDGYGFLWGPPLLAHHNNHKGRYFQAIAKTAIIAVMPRTTTARSDTLNSKFFLNLIIILNS